ncbi:MAG: hypothetical protein DMG28_02965 [Acidobacteria bacterium]|nr:MAG: hypothetical protein DMG28_02965 [Acidobacteriota bacterium]
MKLIHASPQTTRSQAGYALLMVIFLASILLIALSVAAPNLLTQGKRDKEEELIWRGEQYARAVRLYYRKFGRFPQALEDLTQAKNQIRFMRKAYKDPMNAEDGSWRLIYVSPSGQLIGSVRQRSLLIGLGDKPATKRRRARREVAIGDDTQEEDQPISATPPQTPAKAGGDDLTGKVLGGNIIGVGSKVDKTSIRAYEGSTTYREWEFLFDPAKDVAGVGARPGAPVGTPAGTPQKMSQV